LFQGTAVVAVAIDPFDDVSSWTARRANGTASDRISITLDGTPRLPRSFGPARRPSARIATLATAETHRVEWAGAAVDLSDVDDLILWIRGRQRADASAEHPCFASVQLGSAALGVGAVGNDWLRFVPVLAPGTWEFAPLALSDLAPAARGGVNRLRITSIAAVDWELELDGLNAIRSQPSVDTDSAMVALLDGRVIVGGAPVDVVVKPTAAAPADPHVAIRQTGLRAIPAAAATTPMRTDFTDAGFRLRPGSVPVELTYSIDVDSTERADAAQAADSILSVVADTSHLLVNGQPRRIEMLDATAAQRAAGAQAQPAPTVTVRVTTSMPRTMAAERGVRPFNSVDVEVDQHAIA
jgi:hypothetical protein